MNLASMATSPALLLLIKWTALLLLAWCAHAMLRGQDARWRLILWRSVLYFGLLLPVVQLVKLPGIEIPVATDATVWRAPSDPPADATAGNQTTKADSKPTVSKEAAAQFAPTIRGPLAVRPQFGFVISPPSVVATIWLLGSLIGITRLVWLHFSIRRLRKQAVRPTTEIEELSAQVKAALNIRRRVQVRTSDAIVSPFVCDVFQPTILLPQTLVQALSPAELRAVLNHEMAHIRQSDLIWSVAWQWVRAFCWFHPLVWRIPAAHSLACEQEADRVASAQMLGKDSYVQLLAKLALKIIALPAVETRLTVNGSSQIIKRLHWLGKQRMAAWNWRFSVAAFSVSFLLFLVVAGCKTTKDQPGEAGASKVQMKRVLVVVQDEAGQPIVGATITPEGFRVKGIHGADAYGWRKDLFGPAEIVTTDSAGKAYLKYPVIGIPEEKEYTGKLYFSVRHPDYSVARPQEYSVDSPEEPIRLVHGIRLQVSGFFGSDHQAVPELVPSLNEEGIRSEDWQNKSGTVYSYGQMSPGHHLLRLMGRLPSGQIVYSETREFLAEKGQDYHFDLEMKPGIRVEGRLDDNVPRPVINGRVLIGVRPEEFPAWTNWEQVGATFKKYDNFHPWTSYRPIAPDGTFVFEAVPSGELDLIVHGDGFISKNGGVFVRDFGVPQAFSPRAPLTQIEVKSEPTATLELTATTKDGKPVEGAEVYLNPNVIRIPGGLFGDTPKSSEIPFCQPAPLEKVLYSAKTDKHGVAVIRNVPSFTGGMEMEHPQFQVPLQDLKGWRNRYVHVSFTAGETNRMTMVLEPKGASYIGSPK